jgi:uncharacterized protein YdaU (DUF1376 family)
MPWLILKRSKDRWDKATMSLTELFWAQAEPEVFVECIENWSQLVKKRNVETNHKIDNTNTDTKDDSEEKKDQDSNEPQTVMV